MTRKKEIIFLNPFMTFMCSMSAQLINEFKRSEEESVTHKPAIEEDRDLKQLRSRDGCSLSSPLSFLRNVWFHFVFFSFAEGVVNDCPSESSTTKPSTIPKIDPNLTNFWETLSPTAIFVWLLPWLLG